MMPRASARDDAGAHRVAHARERVVRRQLVFVRAVGLTFALCVATACATPIGDAGLQPLLRPHDRLYRPEGPGPFPAVVVLHGCSGVHSKDRRWAERLREEGYVALVVDSLSGRGITTGFQRRAVCAGWTLPGGARAADIGASLAHLRTLSYVDGMRLAVIGFSHGAWAALDFLSLASEGDVSGLRAVVGFYPYCGLASRASWLGLRADVPAFLLLAADDYKTSTESCRIFVEREGARGRRVTLVVYPDVGHSFDWRQSAATDDAHRRVRAFLAEALAPRRAAGEARP